MTPSIDVALWRADRAVGGTAMRAAAGVTAGGSTNVSHTNGLTVLVQAPVRVGVDVELVRPHAYLERLARRSMDDVEYAAWCASGDQLRAFTQHWTRVEAFLKATGVGLRGGLRSRPDATWTVIDLDVGAAHCGALAVEASGRSVQLRWRA